MPEDVFRNEPAVVAAAFTACLARAQGQFSHVVFAVLVFYVLTLLFLGMLVLVPLMRRPAQGAVAGGGH